MKLLNHMDEEDWEEVISFYAKRGDVDTIHEIRRLLKKITEEFLERIDDSDYETESSESSEEYISD